MSYLSFLKIVENSGSLRGIAFPLSHSSPYDQKVMSSSPTQTGYIRATTLISVVVAPSLELGI
jgi:hypothetical protein